MKPLLASGVKLGAHRVRFHIRECLDWSKERGHFMTNVLSRQIGYDGRWDATPTRFVGGWNTDRRKLKRLMHQSLRALRKHAAYY